MLFACSKESNLGLFSHSDRFALNVKGNEGNTYEDNTFLQLNISTKVGHLSVAWASLLHDTD